ncbi:MAG TPA: M17 family metallopeptidase [Steroidobacteraceae bacterium]|nr:M17 family metallopeptidase [Steroidobacteraceae bacterium]
MPDASRLDVYDAVLLLLPTDDKPRGRFVDAGPWQILHRRGKAAHGTVRGASFDNRRQTQAVLGYCRTDAPPFELLRVAGVLAQRALGERADAARIAVLAQCPAKMRAAWQEALYAALAAHAFALPADKRRDAPPRRLGRVDVLDAARMDARRAEVIADATNLARHLTALPPNVLDAGAYRRLLATLARRHRLRLRWHGEAQLARLGAGAFLAVARGNARRDAGIAELRYAPRGRAARPQIALVGKGVLFDTGGTNLKPHKAMLDMHTDMAGSAVALATLVAAARLRIPVVLDAWLAITENSIGPKAYRPQEVIRAVNGTTIQVIHSDAEGRMALADTLALAARRRPRVIIDFATLTGACVYALTERMSGLFASDAQLAEALLTAAQASGERLWQFPFPEDYDTDLDSPTADIAQCAVEGKGDHILATRFLQRFVPREIAWAHVDLSSATRRGGLAHVPTEITGFGARLALTYLLDRRSP